MATESTPSPHLISELTSALPEGFSFYHLGQVEPLPTSGRLDHSPSIYPDSIGVAYRIQGDLRGLFIIVLDKGLDVSIYSELGNILASRLASNLSSSEDGLEIMISPPHVLNHSQLERLMRSQHPVIRKTYTHFDRNLSIPIQTLILLTPEDGNDV
jgi:hypothetical protein